MNPSSELPDPILRNPFADLVSVGCLVGAYESSRVLLKTRFQVEAQGELDGYLRTWGETILPGAGWAATAMLLGILAWRCLLGSWKPLTGLRQFGGVFLESLGLALALWVVARFWGRWIPELGISLGEKHKELWVQTVSLVGAAIYEELVFRVLLLGLLYWFLVRFGTGYLVSGLIAILLSAILFSMAHHQGAPQNSQEKSLFLFRAFCGSILGLILLIRGPGTAIYSHAMYNLLAHFTAYSDPA